MAKHLEISHYSADVVLVPPREKPAQAVRVTVFGPYFPQRAIEPELFVGEARAYDVRISPDQHSLRGLFAQPPPEGGLVRVIYGDSQEGTVREPFSREKIRPLPTHC